MILLLTFVALAVAGQAGTVALSITADQFSNSLGLILFFIAYPIVFWVAWKLAVRWTEPAEEKQARLARVARKG